MNGLPLRHRAALIAVLFFVALVAGAWASTRLILWGAALPCEPRDTIDYTLPPAIAFHVLDDARRLTTHYRVVVW